MIPQSFIQDLLHRVDIVDVVERYVKLKRAGANYVACCPFHNEKTPSFTVSQTKQFYHCFGCGAHGTAISFVMEHGGLGFIDAVKELAQGVGMTVPDVRPESAQRPAADGDDLSAVLLAAAQYYRAQLKHAPHAIAYLRDRGLSGEIAKRFGIGFAPAGWQNLAAAFPDYQARSLVSAGLVKQSEDGRRYDVFRDRIMFPIADVRGNVIGFGGRVLVQGEHKYLNSPETPVFEKGRELYGLYQARRAIREAGRVVVVEGYMDVVALAQAGIEYSVATLGTATTPLHVQKLLRQTDDIVFCFDGDAAGRRAAWRALENSLSQLVDGKLTRFLFLPQGEDPDSYVRKESRAAFESLLSKAMPMSQFLLQELGTRTDLSAAEGRANFIHQAKPLVKQIQAPAFRIQIVRELAEKSRLAPEEIERLCGLEPLIARARPSDSRHARKPPLTPDRRLLRYLIADPSLAESISPERQKLLDGDPAFRAVAELLRLLIGGRITSPAALLESTRESGNASLYSEVAAETLDSSTLAENIQADFDGVFAQLELRQVKSECEQLSARSMNDADRVRYRELQQRFKELKGVADAGAPT